MNDKEKFKPQEVILDEKDFIPDKINNENIIAGRQ